MNGRKGRNISGLKDTSESFTTIANVTFSKTDFVSCKRLVWSGEFLEPRRIAFALLQKRFVRKIEDQIVIFATIAKEDELLTV